MSKVVRFERYGEPDVLRVVDEPVGEPGPGEVRLRVEAIGLNRAESMFRRGEYLQRADFPARIGTEAAGIVEAIGPGVQGVAEGDAVIAMGLPNMSTQGVYGEHAVVPAACLMPRPAGLDAVEAAALGIAYFTSYGVVELGGLAAGQTLVVTAASSSTGLSAIQIANAIGATPIAVTRTAAKKQALLDAGAARVVVSDDEDVAQALREATAGDGADLAYDPIAGPSAETLVAGLKPGGTMMTYGALSMQPVTVSPLTLLGKTIHGYLVFQILGDPAKRERAARFITDRVAAGELKPAVDASAYTLDDITAAHAHLESNTQIGKVVVRVA